MAQRGVQIDQGSLSCPICLDFLKDPVTIPCGHSSCMNCIKDSWDGKDQRGIHSCPQCGKEFLQRPVLQKNIMLAALEEDLKKPRLKPAPADHCYAGPEDVACDVCTGRKRKAVRSCLTCPASYCENHLQPHYVVPGLQRHKLVNPSKNLQENICSKHEKLLEIFCRTDQQCICYLCTMDEHKGHETVPAEAERAEKQKKLQKNQQRIKYRLQDQEKYVKLLQQKVEAINVSADKTVEDSEKIFTELIRLLQERSSDVKQQIRSQQETEVSRVKDVQEKLEQEISELKRKDAELEQLSHTEDHNQFLLNYPSLSALSESTHSSSIKIRPPHFEDVIAAVSELRDKLQDVLRETWTKSSQKATEADNIQSEPEPNTRDEFLKYSQKITLDLNTVNRKLKLSEGNRKVTSIDQEQSYPDHPDRFTGYCYQVLSVESLTGRCYWELEMRGGGVVVAVSYNNIGRTEEFGFNDKSWSIFCKRDSYTFYHNKVQTPVPGPVSSRLGVYLDHRAGILCFYSVSETMTLLHRVQTRFTQPLNAGVYVHYGSSAEFIKLNRGPSC